MGIVDAIKNLFSPSNAEPADLRRLSGASENALAASLQSLPTGERGWITIAESARLFSNEEQQYAFGEFDEEGKTRLGEFAAQYRCRPDFRPTEGRLYFERP
jgi:hypothetical protein